MAKQAKTAIKTKDAKAAAETKNWTRVIRVKKNGSEGTYGFSSAMVHKDKIKEFLAKK